MALSKFPEDLAVQFVSKHSCQLTCHTWMCLLAEWVKFWVNYPCKSPKTQQLRLTGIVALSSVGAAGSGEKGWPEWHALAVRGRALLLHCLLCSLPLGHHRGAFPLPRWVWCLHGKKIHFALMSKSCDDVSFAAFIANWGDLAFHKDKWALWRGKYRIDLDLRFISFY